MKSLELRGPIPELLLLTLWLDVAHAASITVTHTNQSLAGSLRQAIQDATSATWLSSTIRRAMPA